MLSRGFAGCSVYARSQIVRRRLKLLARTPPRARHDVPRRSVGSFAKCVLRRRVAIDVDGASGGARTLTVRSSRLTLLARRNPDFLGVPPQTPSRRRAIGGKRSVKAQPRHRHPRNATDRSSARSPRSAVSRRGEAGRPRRGGPSIAAMWLTPGIVEAQIQSGVIYGLSKAALYGEDHRQAKSARRTGQPSTSIRSCVWLTRRRLRSISRSPAARNGGGIRRAPAPLGDGAGGRQRCVCGHRYVFVPCRSKNVKLPGRSD